MALNLADPMGTLQNPKPMETAAQNMNQAGQMTTGLGQSIMGMAPRIQAGPQNAFSPQQLSGLYTQGVSNLANANKQMLAGAAQSGRARGTAGPDLGTMLGSQIQSSDRAALAKGSLAAQLEGMKQGTADYAALTGGMGELGNLYGTTTNQNLQRMAMGMTQVNNLYQSYQQDQQAADSFMDKYAAQLKDKSLGEGMREAYRSFMEKLTRKAEASRKAWENAANYYSQGLGGPSYSNDWDAIGEFFAGAGSNQVPQSENLYDRIMAQASDQSPEEVRDWIASRPTGTTGIY